MDSIINHQNNQITFVDKRYYLKPDGTFVPSVTTVLDAYPKDSFLIEWIRKHGDDGRRHMERAGERGTHVHDLTESYDQGDLVSLLDHHERVRFSSDVWSMFERYVTFRNLYHSELEVIENETRFVDDLWAGTIDRVFSFQDQLWMVDLKTSTQIHNVYWLQLAAYAHSYEKIHQKTIDRIAILHLNSKTRTLKKESFQGEGWKLYFCPISHQEKFKLFEIVYRLWLEINKKIVPKNITYQLSHQRQYEPTL